MLDAATILLASIGGIFFLAGTVGMLRFPDAYCRLHALTKADNLGLGFIVAALILQAGSVAAAAKLLLVWLLALTAAASSAYLIAHAAVTADDPPPAATDPHSNPEAGDGD